MQNVGRAIGAILALGLSICVYADAPFDSMLKEAKAGDAESQFQIGCAYADGAGVSLDYVEAVTWYQKAAEQGHAQAQFNMGDACRYGEGISQDYAEAVKWYRKAAEQGHAEAQFNLGLVLSLGLCVSEDHI